MEASGQIAFSCVT